MKTCSSIIACVALTAGKTTAIGNNNNTIANDTMNITGRHLLDVNQPRQRSTTFDLEGIGTMSVEFFDYSVVVSVLSLIGHGTAVIVTKSPNEDSTFDYQMDLTEDQKALIEEWFNSNN